MERTRTAVLGLVAIGIGLTTGHRLTAQQPLPDPLPTFGVASVKKAPTSGPLTMSLRAQGGRVMLTNLPLRLIITQAWGIRDNQISGGPSWMATDRFTINAKADYNAPRDQLLLMLRSLLAERFKLKARIEKREMPAYVLSRINPDAPFSPKLRPTTCPAPPAALAAGMVTATAPAAGGRGVAVMVAPGVAAPASPGAARQGGAAAAAPPGTTLPPGARDAGPGAVPPNAAPGATPPGAPASGANPGSPSPTAPAAASSGSNAATPPATGRGAPPPSSTPAAGSAPVPPPPGPAPPPQPGSAAALAAAAAAAGARSGAPPPPQQFSSLPNVRCGSLSLVSGTIRGGGVPLTTILSLMSSAVGGQVVDRTGITGNVDIEIEFNLGGLGSLQAAAPGANTPVSINEGPSIFTALKDVGLKLERRREQAEMLVIDSVEQPDED